MCRDSIKEVLKVQEALGRTMEPFLAQIRALETDSTLHRLVKDAQRQQELIRASLGPFDELRRSVVFDPASKLGAEFQKMRDLVVKQQEQFRLPEIVEAARLLDEFQSSGAANAIARFREHQSAIQRAMEAMHAPWLDIENRMQSIAGFVELQGIGRTLSAMPAFDSELADRLRIGLGDWRTEIDWPTNIFTDPLARAAFYAARGLDPSLSNFPTAAFEQSVTIAGIKREPPPLATSYDFAAEGQEEEVGFARTNEAHDRLQRFESQMRKFIDEQMRAAFGDSWIKHQVPGEIHKAWSEKRQKGRDSGEPERPLIAYADFADYVPIIVRKDNWQTVFEPIFKRPMLVQESFQRLYPIRICTMHARIITQDDELYLYAETKRLLAAIGIEV